MPVCACAAVFFVSECVRGVLVCGRLLYAVKLSFEALFNICGKETLEVDAATARALKRTASVWESLGGVWSAATACLLSLRMQSRFD